MKKLFIFLLLIMVSDVLFAQTTHREIKTAEYKELQEKLCRGWNTWYNNSMITQAHLPEGFAIALCLTNKKSPDYLNEVFKASDFLKRPESVVPGLRADDGSYTSITVKYK